MKDDSDMKDLKNLLKLFGIAAWAVGIIGGVGYCCYLHKYLIAANILMLGIEAFPLVKTWFPKKQSKEDK